MNSINPNLLKASVAKGKKENLEADLVAIGLTPKQASDTILIQRLKLMFNQKRERNMESQGGGKRTLLKRKSRKGKKGTRKH